MKIKSALPQSQHHTRVRYVTLNVGTANPKWKPKTEKIKIKIAICIFD